MFTEKNHKQIDIFSCNDIEFKFLQISMVKYIQCDFEYIMNDIPLIDFFDLYTYFLIDKEQQENMIRKQNRDNNRGR